MPPGDRVCRADGRWRDRRAGKVGDGQAVDLEASFLEAQRRIDMRGGDAPACTGLRHLKSDRDPSGASRRCVHERGASKQAVEIERAALQAQQHGGRASRGT